MIGLPIKGFHIKSLCESLGNRLMMMMFYLFRMAAKPQHATGTIGHLTLEMQQICEDFAQSRQVMDHDVDDF